MRLRPGGGRPPWGLLGAVVVIAIVEFAVSWNDLDLTRTEYLDWRLARRAAGGKATRADVICLGTSMVQQGVFPEVIERRTGRVTQNLALCAGHTPIAYYHLRRALAAGARPSAVVMDVHPAMIADSYRDQDAGWVEGLGVVDSFDMAWAVGDPSFLARMLLGKAIPSIQLRHPVRDRIVAALKGRGESRLLTNLAHTRNIVRNKGAMVGIRIPTYDGKVEDRYKPIWLEPARKDQFDPFATLYVDRLLRLAAEHRIKVYWLILPVAPGLTRRRDELALNASYDAFVDRFSGYKNLVVVDGRRSGYPPTVFMDTCHLDPQGGADLSRDLAALLQRTIPLADAETPRRVSLPAYRAGKTDAPLEDLFMSIRMVQDGSRVRR